MDLEHPRHKAAADAARILIVSAVTEHPDIPVSDALTLKWRNYAMKPELSTPESTAMGEVLARADNLVLDSSGELDTMVDYIADELFELPEIFTMEALRRLAGLFRPPGTVTAEILG